MAVAFFVAWGLLPTRPADACKMPRNAPFEVDAAAPGPATPPPKAVVGEVKLKRGQAGSLALGNCSNYSVLTFRVSSAANDRAIGYRIEALGGTLPDGLTLPAYPIAAFQGRILFWWNDNSVFQRPLDFELRVIPVDAQGEEGEPADPIRIRDGWHVAWLVKVLAIAGAIFALVLTRRKRQGRIRPGAAV